jgi:hypothetical protein
MPYQDADRLFQTLRLYFVNRRLSVRARPSAPEEILKRSGFTDDEVKPLLLF